MREPERRVSQLKLAASRVWHCPGTRGRGLPVAFGQA